jgi:MoxR-like ATPase
MMKVLVGYPSATEEFVVVERALAPAAVIQRIIDPETLVGLQQEADRVYVDPSLIEYAVTLAHASREPGRVGLTDLARYVTFGASPRSSISLVLAARALAYIRGREYVVPEDLTDLALDVLRHRLVLSYEALSDEVTPDLILSKILANVSVPEPAGRGR